MHRFFVTPEILQHESIILSGSQAHQIRRVLRMRAGDRIVLLDNRGNACEAEIETIDREVVRATAMEWSTPETEPRTEVTLFLALLKGEHFDWALQKGTEIGVRRFVPLICERNVVNESRTADEKHGRWESIVQEAAEQSGRARLPILMPAVPLAVALQVGARQMGDADPAPLRLICWEEERSCSIGEALRACNVDRTQRIELYVGPEGGLSDQEVRQAVRAGATSVSLGSRILRAETAAIVATTLALHYTGNL